MERCFIATKESKFTKAMSKYKEDAEIQRLFVIDFMNEHNIEAHRFLVGGTGSVGSPFEEYYKSDITLSIDATENDLKNFGTMLKVPSKRHGLRAFKKSSTIAKEFAQKCVDNKIIINLWKPRVGNYFESIGHMGTGYHWFEVGEDIYIKVDSDYLKEDDTPEGFIEIKRSEFFTKLEEIEGQKS